MNEYNKEEDINKEDNNSEVDNNNEKLNKIEKIKIKFEPEKHLTENFIIKHSKNEKFFTKIIDCYHKINIIYSLSRKLIHLICQYCTPNMVKYALDKNCELEAIDDLGMRPIHYICIYQPNNVILYSIKKNLNLEVEMWNKKRPIHLICENELFSNEIFYTIVEKNVDLEARDIMNWRPIHHVCLKFPISAVLYLINKGVDLNVQTDSGNTPAHFLCENKNITKDVLCYFLNKDVNLEIKNRINNKPIDIACYNLSLELIKCLIDKGVDLNSISYYGVSALKILTNKFGDKIVRNLLRKRKRDK
jgi:ankyrin repeat protein